MIERRHAYQRWLQFRLRTLLIVVLLLSLPLSWFGTRLARAGKQREAVVAIKRLGGSVVYDWEDASSSSAAKPPSSWLRTLLGDDFFDTIVRVEFWDPCVTNADLKHVDVLTELQTLVLFSTHVTDSGLVHLEHLSELRTLSLLCRQTTDTGLEHLHGLDKLQHLCCSSTVTDAGLEHLKLLTNLKRLRFHDENATDEGIENLQEALPDCEIDFFLD